MLSVVMLSIIMLSVVMRSIVILSLTFIIVMLSVVLLNVSLPHGWLATIVVERMKTVNIVQLFNPLCFLPLSTVTLNGK